MIEQAITKIAEMVKPALTQIGNKTFLDGKILHTSKLFMKPKEINTLTGIVDYVESGIDGTSEQEIRLMAIVESYDRVLLTSDADKELKKRHNILGADSRMCEFSFNQKMPIEPFIIGLQANFQFTEDAEKILKFVSALKTSDVKEVNDSGVSQEVRMKSGVRSENEGVPNPVILKPWRTFTEVEQPASRFIFRIGKDSNQMPVCGLYEADGGAWKNEAIINIRDYLKKNLPKDITIIA